MTDRVLLGKNEAGDNGLWVSKPGANVSSLAGNTYLRSLGAWYGYQEEFDGDGTDGAYGTTFVSSPNITIGEDSGRVKKTSNGTMGFSPNAQQSYFLTKGTSDVFFVGATYPILEIKLRLVDHQNADNPAPADSAAAPDLVFDWINEPLLYNSGTTFRRDMPGNFTGNTINSWDQGTSNPNPDMSISTFDSSEYSSYDGTYTSIFNDNEYKILRWDMSNEDAWMDPNKYIMENGGEASAHPNSSSYRIRQLYFQLNYKAHGAGSGEVDVWEIDSIRALKKGVPRDAGRYGSLQDSLLFDSDINHMGLVHQTGTVTIGTAKALINGNTSDRVVGHNIDNDANGYVSFPELDYIPLVLFQRIDENVAVTGASYPGGEDEFSICLQNWEDHRYPTMDINTSEPEYKGFDIQTQTDVRNSSYEVFSTSWPRMYENFCAQLVGSINGIEDGPGKRAGIYHWSEHDNLLETQDGYYGAAPGVGYIGHYSGVLKTAAAPGTISHPFYDGLDDTNYPDTSHVQIRSIPYPTSNSWGDFSFDDSHFKPSHFGFYPITEEYQSLGEHPLISDVGYSNQELPWEFEIPTTSARAGRKFTDMVESFSEVRTFAYARAKKDGFWLTCRNAIAQEGMEPALNFAPVLPEEGGWDQGSAAFQSMVANNDNGAWGMFHPALALYDGQKFSEGLELKWDTRTTANSLLLDLTGKFPQYKTWPSFSCSGLPFDGSLARPNHRPPKRRDTWGPNQWAPMGAAFFETFADNLGKEYLDAFLRPHMNTTGWFGHDAYPVSYDASNTSPEYNNPYGHIYDATYTIQNDFSADKGTTKWNVANFRMNGKLRGDTGGFYPYRLQSNRFLLSNNYNTSATDFNMFGGMQYNIKRISSPGIVHPEGIVPDYVESFDNRNIDKHATPPGTDSSGNLFKTDSYVPGTNGPLFTYEHGATLTANIYNQTSYIGGAMNTKQVVPEYFYSNDIRPKVSPDGTKIAFQSDGMLTRTGSRPKYDIWVMDINGDNRTNLTACTAANDEWPSWSPDGTQIAFHTDRHGNKEIYKMNSSDGSSQTRLTSTSTSNNYQPAWAPTNAGAGAGTGIVTANRIAFVSDRKSVADGLALRFPTWSNGRGVRYTLIYTIDADTLVTHRVGTDSGNINWEPSAVSSSGKSRHGWYAQSPTWSPHSTVGDGLLAFIAWDVEGGLSKHSEDSIDGRQCALYYMRSHNSSQPPDFLLAAHNVWEGGDLFGGAGEVITDIDGEPNASEMEWGPPVEKFNMSDSGEIVRNAEALSMGTKISYTTNSSSTSDVNCITLAPSVAHHGDFTPSGIEVRSWMGDFTDGMSGPNGGFIELQVAPDTWSALNRPRRITDDTHISNIGGSWTPDGKAIVFSSNRRGVQNPNVPSGGGYDIYITKDDTNTLLEPISYRKISLIASNTSVSFDKTKTKPPKYKYWVLRVPVNIPEYT